MPFEIPWKIEVPAPFTVGQLSTVELIGFLLVFGLIWKFGGPFFRTILGERHKSIVDAAAQVEATRQETSHMLSDYQNRLAKIEDETEARMNEAVREADALREQILTEARESAEALIRRGHDEVSRERAKSLVRLRSLFVEDTVRAAEYAATRSLDPTNQRRLVDDFVTGIGGNA